MFSGANRRDEFRSAKAEHPEWIPVGACYHHLPMIQTGFALKALIDLGFADDPRVIAGCENLVELHGAYGGWCDTNIRCGLQAKARQARGKR